jgi:hypothetical protein
MTPTKPLAEQIELMIDAHGLLHVLTAIECICGEKAEHIRVNWQDRNTAKPWDIASKAVGAAARKVEV